MSFSTANQLKIEELFDLYVSVYFSLWSECLPLSPRPPTLVHVNQEGRKPTVKYKGWSLNPNDVGLPGKRRLPPPPGALGNQGGCTSVEHFITTFSFHTMSLILLSLWVFLCDILIIIIKDPQLPEPLFLLPLIIRSVIFGNSTSLNICFLHFNTDTISVLQESWWLN